MKITIYTACLCILFLNSCVGGFGFALKKHLFGNYYLTATDDIEGSALSYHKKADENIWGIIIGPTVFSVGFNKDYLIAKQYYNSFYEDKMTTFSCNNGVDKNNIRYYILPIKEEMNWRTLNGLLGPLDYQEFEDKRKEFGISNIKFSVEIDMGNGNVSN